MRISDWSSDVCSSDLLPVEDEALFGGAIVLIDTQAAADAAEKKFLPAQSTSAEGQGWVEHYIFRPIAERTAPWLLRQQIQPRHLRIGAMVTADRKSTRLNSSH